MLNKTEQKREERSKVQDRFLNDEITKDECLRLLKEIDNKYKALPSKRDIQNHNKFMALYAPIVK